MRIVLVDDAAILRTLFTRIVTALGHSVAEADTEVAALALARALVPDVIVLDGRLGGGDLARTVSAFRDTCPGSAVFVVVAADEPVLAQLARAGGAGLLRRPYSRAQIRDVLSAWETARGGEGV